MFKFIFRNFKKPFKRLKVYIKYKAGWLGIPKIIAYNGHGTPSEIFVTGSVIEDKGLAKPQDRQKVWQNILAAVKRFSSDEMAGVKVKATFLGTTKTMETDEQGFFSFHFKYGENLKDVAKNGWVSVEYELMDQVVVEQPKTTATGYVRIITDNDERIFVSDIDDTVLVSHSTQTLKKLKLMLFKNALTRKPFNGVSRLYDALSKGKGSDSNYPFFYVSSSEWNLYDLLDDFFRHNQLPKGVFMLRKLEHSILKFWKSGQGNHQHKYEKIKHLLDIFNTQKFVLIGDSGQHDQQIYKQLALDFPERIETIYIRKVGVRKLLNLEKDISSELNKVNTNFFDVENSTEVARHAFRYGYVDQALIKEMEIENLK